MITKSEYKLKSVALAVLLKREKSTKKDTKKINELIHDITDYEEKQGLVKPLKGISLELSKYKLNKWSKLIKTREDYVCYMCNSDKIEKIESHHIYPKGIERYIPKAYNLDNGITLCHRCHRRIVHISWVNWKKFVSMFRQYMRRKKVSEYNNLKQRIL